MLMVIRDYLPGNDKQANSQFYVSFPGKHAIKTLTNCAEGLPIKNVKQTRSELK